MRANTKMLKLFCAAALTLSPVLVATPAVAQTVESRLAAYRERVDRLEDQAAIENLQTTFGFYFDKGLWDEASSLFSRTGSFEYEQRGVYKGPARIERAMLLLGPQGLGTGYLHNHMMLQNVIIVADGGRTATGRWQGPVQLSKPNSNGVWAVGIYENEYVKEGGVWKISKFHFYLTAKTDYDQGWGKSQLPMEGPSALFPPDSPPSEVYRSMPGAYLPPFSYDHPVTGQSLKGLPMAGDDITGREPVVMAP